MLNYISAVGIQPKISRCVGMADDADSKSVGCTPVRVQVPPPAVNVSHLQDVICSRSLLRSSMKMAAVPVKCITSAGCDMQPQPATK